jgi:hypothetical protein
MKEMSALVASLEQLSVTFTGLWVSPPALRGPSRFGSLIQDLEILRADLDRFLKESKRRNVAQDFHAAQACAYVEGITGDPHDKEIADLFGFPSAEAARGFRKRCAKSIVIWRRALAPVLPPPHKPRALRRRHHSGR